MAAAYGLFRKRGQHRTVFPDGTVCLERSKFVLKNCLTFSSIVFGTILLKRRKILSANLLLSRQTVIDWKDRTVLPSFSEKTVSCCHESVKVCVKGF